MSMSLRLESSRVITRKAVRFSYGRALVPTRLRSRANSAVAQRTRLVTQMGLFGLGAPELLVIAGVAALIFGPSKLPELGRGLGKTVKEVQSAAKEFRSEMEKEMEADDTEDASETKKEEATVTSGTAPKDPTSTP